MKKKRFKKFKTFSESFDFFDDWKYKTNEYCFHLSNGLKAETQSINTIVVEGLHEEIIELDDNLGVTIVKKEAITRFHPNNINNKEFWLRAHKSFPLLSVCGGNSKNINEVNNNTLKLSENFNLFPFLKDEINNSKSKLNILEIGFGFGNVFKEIKNHCDYIGIDYRIPKLLKKYKNFIEINESGIPDYLRDEELFDIIYCVNVLQHCSQKDRFDYFTQGYSALKKGGYFIFSCLLMTKDNQNESYWGIKDTNGRGYLHFFNQLTEADYEHEIFGHLNSLGYKSVDGWLINNHLAMIIKK